MKPRHRPADPPEWPSSLKLDDLIQAHAIARRRADLIAFDAAAASPHEQGEMALRLKSADRLADALRSLVIELTAAKREFASCAVPLAEFEREERRASNPRAVRQEQERAQRAAKKAPKAVTH